MTAPIDRIMARAHAAWPIPDDVDAVWRRVLTRHDPGTVLTAIDVLAAEWPAQLAGRPPLLVLCERIIELEAASRLPGMDPDDAITAARAALDEGRAAVADRTGIRQHPKRAAP